MVSRELVLQFNLAELHARAGECPRVGLFRRETVEICCIWTRL